MGLMLEARRAAVRGLGRWTSQCRGANETLERGSPERLRLPKIPLPEPRNVVPVGAGSFQLELLLVGYAS